MPEQTAVSILYQKRFWPLFVAQFMGAFNDNAFKNALVIMLTYQAAGKVGVDPHILVTASAGIFILPFFLFSAIAGQVADKFSKTGLIRLVKFTEIPIILVVAFGFWAENYWLLLFMLFVAGIHAAFFGPLKYSILPELLQKHELVTANALVEAGTFLSILMGTIAGGILVMAENGPELTSLLLLVVATVGWLASLKLPETELKTPSIVIGWNIFGETSRLLKSALADTVVRRAVIGISWFWLVGFTFLAQFPVYTKQVLGADETVVTFFMTVFSVGIGAGSMLCSRLLKGRIRGVFIPLSLVGMAISSMALWAVSPSGPDHAGLMGLSQFLSHGTGMAITGTLVTLSAFAGIYIVPIYTILQTSAAEGSRSRVVAANNVMNALFMVVAALITMALFRLGLGVKDILLLAGGLGCAMVPVLRPLVKDHD